jgi:PAS domain S-box-containing protein
MHRPSAAAEWSARGLSRLLVENIPDHAVFALDPQGRVQSWSAPAERLLGYGEAEVLGQPAARFYTQADLADDVPARELEQATRSGRVEQDRWYVRKDGSRFWSGGVTKPLFDASGTLRGFAKIMRDQTAVKQAQDARDDALAYARSIVETVREPLLVLEGCLRVLSANRAFYRTFRVEPADTEGRCLYDLGNGQWDIPELRTLLEEVLPESTSFDDFEVEHDFPGIGRKVMLLNARKLRQEGAELILLAIEDITGRRWLTAERQAIETSVKSLVKNVQDQSIFALDTEGRVTSWNIAAEHILGWSEAEALGRHFSFIFTPRDRARDLAEAELRAAREHGRAEDERWYLRRGGERFWALGIVSALRDAQGRLTGFSKILRDMTAWKTTQEALREREAQLAAEADALARLNDASSRLWHARGLDEGLQAMLDAALDLLGADKGNIQLLHGEHLRIAVHQGFGADFLDFFREVSAGDDSACGRALRTGERMVIEDVETDPPFAPMRPITRAAGFRAVVSTPILGRAGKPLGMFSTHFRSPHRPTVHELRRLDLYVRQAADFIERARTEQALRESETRLRALASQLSQAEQRERKRLAKVLHDHIQQLIVAARMQVGSLRHDLSPERRMAAAQGVDSILDEALQASRSLVVELSPPVLDEAGLIGGLEWLVSRVESQHGLSVRLRADATAEPASEELRFLLFESVRELLLNVVKHTGVGTAEVTLMRASDTEIRLIVRDKGAGFDPNALRRRRHGAASFGLFSVQERLAHLGGRMEIESAPGRGTRVTLVVASPKSAQADTRPRNAKTAETKTLSLRTRPDACRVLIVDDHAMMREGLASLFELESDFEVVGQAADGPEAIAATRILAPDVVLMDVNLGEMDGIEATRRILASHPNIKVIGLSMHVDETVARAMRDAGAVAYLTKGGRSDDLIGTIRSCCKGQPASAI